MSTLATRASSIARKHFNDVDVEFLSEEKPEQGPSTISLISAARTKQCCKPVDLVGCGLRLLPIRARFLFTKASARAEAAAAAETLELVQLGLAVLVSSGSSDVRKFGGDLDSRSTTDPCLTSHSNEQIDMRVCMDATRLWSFLYRNPHLDDNQRGIDELLLPDAPVAERAKTVGTLSPLRSIRRVARSAVKPGGSAALPAHRKPLLRPEVDADRRCRSRGVLWLQTEAVRHGAKRRRKLN